MSEQTIQKKSFKDTLNLPTTDFPIRSNHKEDDPKMIVRWEQENMYQKTFHHNSGAKKFILHDGPPYANGHLHIGHAYNKILKDIVTKSQRMSGNHVPVTPGWDCHGLPIEFAVKKEQPELVGSELKKACRNYASKWIAIQKEEFKQLGVLMDWDNPYLTMSYEYEADTIRAFGNLVDQNYIERKNKTVPWCPTCQTVLASAEIEYSDRKDPSIYVLFTLTDSVKEMLFPQLQGKSVSLLVWTTTPWTLPLNRAVLLKPHTEYVVLKTFVSFDELRTNGEKSNSSLIPSDGYPMETKLELGANGEKSNSSLIPSDGYPMETKLKLGANGEKSNEHNEQLMPNEYDERLMLQQTVTLNQDEISFDNSKNFSSPVRPEPVEGYEPKSRYIIVGKERADAIVSMLGIEKIVVAEFMSNDLVAAHATVVHPLIENFNVPVLLDDSVLTDDGTACVHCAPGAGPIDYEVGVKNNLEIYSPITNDGRYTADIKPALLAGMTVADAQGWVITRLLENNNLAYKTSIKHSYPHCWRCRGGLIFRATKQWFCDLSRNNLKEKTVEAVNTIAMFPKASHNRFEATIEGRLEWCLSRQRTWGVPIPAFICNGCDATYITKELITTVAMHMEKQGIEYWDSVTTESLAMLDMQCKQCNGKAFTKETDILDVWFDSGISHYAVLQKNDALAYPADIYLEGKDQHRGWFQSSLLTSMIIEKRPCMKAIVTHGFTVDAHGRKMSKSIGNVMSPQEMVDMLGTDGVRLWTASIDTGGDAVVSDVLLKNIQEVFRKIRITCRFLISNIYDFDVDRDSVSLESLSAIDQYALQELFAMHSQALEAYENYDFTRVAHSMGNYCSADLSSFYLDIVKDRLYVEKSDGLLRRSAQTVCYIILDTLTKIMAPILSFTAEQLSDHYQKNKTISIHLQNFSHPMNIWQALANEDVATSKLIMSQMSAAGRGGSIFEALGKGEAITAIDNQEKRWNVLKDIRSALLKAIEIQRAQQLIKHSLEARVTIHIASDAPYASYVTDFMKALQKGSHTPESFFKEFLIVSQCSIVADHKDLETTELQGLYARVEHAQGTKCPRCWNWDTADNEGHLCNRCEKVLGL